MGWSPLRIAAFLAVVLAVVGGGHLYLYRRLFRATTGDRRVRRVGAVLLAVLALALVFARVIATRFHAPVGDAVAVVAWCWMGVGMYLGLSLAVAQLAGWASKRRRRSLEPPSIERRRFLARMAVGGAAMATTGFASYGVWRAFQPPEITELALKLPRLPAALDGLRIVQISDVHAGDVLGGAFLAEMVRRCNALRPDLVAVTGDLVDGSVERLGPAISALEELRSRFGTLFVTGNHEYYSGDVAWADALERMGITVLRNRTVTLGDAGGRLDVVGVEDWGQRGAPHGRGYDLAAALAGRNRDHAAMLLAHQPRDFETAVAEGLGLQLSGHTHGGQLFPITALVRAVWPYSAGLYRREDAHLYVSRGTGFWGPPMRVGSAPEIVVVNLLA